jgi:hypothetical protein
MLSEPERRLVERELGMISDVELVKWATAALADDAVLASDPDIVELASLPASNPRKCESAVVLLRRAVQSSNPDFDISSKDAQVHARAGFLALCKRLVSTELPPYEFCKVISPIELTFEYPDWLEKFYDHCDWCEPDSTRYHFDHLIQYAARYLVETEDADRQD